MKKALLTGALAVAAMVAPAVLATESASAAPITMHDGISTHTTIKTTKTTKITRKAAHASSKTARATSSTSRVTVKRKTIRDPRVDIRIHKFVLNSKTYILPSCQSVINGGVYVSPSCGASLARPTYILRGRTYALPGSWNVQTVTGLPGRWYGLPGYRLGTGVHEYILDERTYLLPECQYVVNGGVYVSPSCEDDFTTPVYLVDGRWRPLPGSWCDQPFVSLPGRWYGLPGHRYGNPGHNWGGTRWGGHWGNGRWGNGRWGHDRWGGGHR
ncbi:hypothetical protein Mth01_50560 [Sphaerimonospora thailandensis]|uniref:Uncharacterized protein n=2 Tax=Sphaerimonospora thailandensis TaxID=795644 RepID=A0A8J3RD37_9ACTN|nr:hypothetical protein Mth01_50560 [Sphaerimonospora thailandensis]